MTRLPNPHQRLLKHFFSACFIAGTSASICGVSLATGWGLDPQPLEAHSTAPLEIQASSAVQPCCGIAELLALVGSH